ncbi:MAG: transglutaminase domain-containing protein [Desulfofustis sp.]|nr:transglutaminase domain-containing protein [Desulfofustis sp.]
MLHRFLPALLVILLATGCSPSWLSHQANLFFLYNGPDQPLTEETRTYLRGASQSEITSAIKAIALQIEADTRRERMLKAIDYLWSHFSYDNREAHLSFTRTADELFQSKVLGGCSDFALVQSVLFRALAIPARLVVTADVEWMEKYKENNLFMTRGHVFIEVYLENRWYLVDTAYRTIYLDYQLGRKSYPRNQFFCFRGTDYWDIGIKTVADVDRLLRAIALAFNPQQYRDPVYTEETI